jgi:hypothetical protein
VSRAPLPQSPQSPHAGSGREPIPWVIARAARDRWPDPCRTIAHAICAPSRRSPNRGLRYALPHARRPMPAGRARGEDGSRPGACSRPSPPDIAPSGGQHRQTTDDGRFVIIRESGWRGKPRAWARSKGRRIGVMQLATWRSGPIFGLIPQTLDGTSQPFGGSLALPPPRASPPPRFRPGGEHAATPPSGSALAALEFGVPRGILRAGPLASRFARRHDHARCRMHEH